MDKKIQKTEKCRSIDCKSVPMMRTKFRSVFLALFIGIITIGAVQNGMAQNCSAYNYDPTNAWYGLRGLQGFGGGHLTLPSSVNCDNGTAPVGQLGWASYQVSASLQNPTQYPNEIVTGITLPLSCKFISAQCFYNSSGQVYPLVSLDAPGVTEIAENAFRNQTLLTSVNLPAIEIIRGFQGCTSLSSIALPNTLKVIGTYAFTGCTALTSLTLPNSLKEIGSAAFWNSGLTSVVLPESIETIGSSAFQGSAIESINLPPSLINLSSNSFNNCAKLRIIFYNCINMHISGRQAFTNLENPNCHIVIGNNFESLNWGYFLDVKAGRYTIPNSITHINDLSFAGNINLKKIEIPSSVIYMDNNVFSGSSSLKQITVPWEIPLELRIKNDTVQGIINSAIRLIVPRGTKSLYAAATSNWRKFIIMENVEVSAVPQENSAIISWYKEDEATGYTLTVYTDFAQTQVFGKYELNENGQRSTRLSYTVEGLTKETQYWYTLEALSGTDVIAVFENNFVTTDGTGIADIYQNETIKIYPNPTTGHLTIESSKLKVEQVTIYDAMGRSVLTSRTTTLNISHLSNGVYFVILKTDKGELTTKIIKE